MFASRSGFGACSAFTETAEILECGGAGMSLIPVLLSSGYLSSSERAKAEHPKSSHALNLLQSTLPPSPPLPDGAPLTRAVVLASVASSLAIQTAAGARLRLPMSIRRVKWQLGFASPGELLVGTGLLYFSRLFERRKGSAQTGVQILLKASLAFVFERVLSRWGWLGASVAHARGPYLWIFSSVLEYTLDVPAVESFQIFGMQLSEKILGLMLAARLATTHGRGSAIRACCAMAAEAILRFNVFGCGSLSMALTRGATKFLPPGKCEAVVFAPFTTAPPAPRAPPLRPQGAPPVAEVSAEALEQLEAMGFEPDRARAALVNAGNDLQGALYALLS